MHEIPIIDVVVYLYQRVGWREFPTLVGELVRSADSVFYETLLDIRENSENREEDDSLIDMAVEILSRKENENLLFDVREMMRGRDRFGGML